MPIIPGEAKSIITNLFNRFNAVGMYRLEINHIIGGIRPPGSRCVSTDCTGTNTIEFIKRIFTFVLLRPDNHQLVVGLIQHNPGRTLDWIVHWFSYLVVKHHAHYLSRIVESLLQSVNFPLKIAVSENFGKKRANFFETSLVCPVIICYSIGHKQADIMACLCRCKCKMISISKKDKAYVT